MADLITSNLIFWLDTYKKYPLAFLTLLHIERIMTTCDLQSSDGSLNLNDRSGWLLLLGPPDIFYFNIFDVNSSDSRSHIPG